MGQFCIAGELFWRLLHHKIYKFTRHADCLDNCFALYVLGSGYLRGCLHRRGVGTGGHHHASAHLAEHLNGDLDLVGGTSAASNSGQGAV